MCTFRFKLLYCSVHFLKQAVCEFDNSLITNRDELSNNKFIKKNKFLAINICLLQKIQSIPEHISLIAQKRMKINENIKLVGNKVILIPYESKHVEKYHHWMQNPELQEQTASEPLTLEEEYSMQQSWRLDEDKCTFLILSKELYSSNQDEIEALIGDTNLFITEEDNGHKKGEAEIMIAEKTFRGQHLGWEAMLIMLSYGVKDLGIQEYIVKIGENNSKSISMFKKMSFSEISRSSVFKELTMQRIVNNEWIEWLNSEVQYSVEEYDKNKM